MTYFQFLYRFCYKPFLSDRVKARGIIYERNPDPRPTQQDKIADTKARKKNIRIFLEALKGTSSLLYRFDTALWHRLVDYVTVTPEETLVFHMRDGSEMTVSLEEVH